MSKQFEVVDIGWSEWPWCGIRFILMACVRDSLFTRPKGYESEMVSWKTRPDKQSTGEGDRVIYEAGLRRRTRSPDFTA